MNDKQPVELQPFKPVEDFGQRFHWDSDGDKFHIETFQDVAPYLRRNKRMYNENSVNKRSTTRSSALLGRHLASVPEVIYHKWMKEYQKKNGLKFPPTNADYQWVKFQRQKLRDPDNRFLRVDGRKD